MASPIALPRSGASRAHAAPLADGDEPGDREIERGGPGRQEVGRRQGRRIDDDRAETGREYRPTSNAWRELVP